MSARSTSSVVWSSRSARPVNGRRNTRYSTDPINMSRMSSGSTPGSTSSGPAAPSTRWKLADLDSDSFGHAPVLHRRGLVDAQQCWHRRARGRSREPCGVEIDEPLQVTSQIVRRVDGCVLEGVEDRRLDQFDAVAPSAVDSGHADTGTPCDRLDSRVGEADLLQEMEGRLDHGEIDLWVTRTAAGALGFPRLRTSRAFGPIHYVTHPNVTAAWCPRRVATRSQPRLS